MIALPDLTLTITTPGGSPVDCTRWMTYDGANNQMTITQNFGRQGDTAVIVLTDEYVSSPNVIIQVMSQIELYDNTIGVTLFAGVVNDPILTVTGPTRNEWTLNCTDYTFYADNSTPVTGQYNGYTVDQIVVAITEQANCGITAATVANGGFVAPGPLLPDVSIPYSELSTAWRTLASLASQVTPYGWYVDENLALHFYDSSSALDSGVTFTTTPTVAGSATEGHIALDSEFAYEWDGTSVHNRILVQGATQTIAANYQGSPTDTFVGDGITTSWALRYTLTGTPTLTVGTVNTAVNVVTAGGSPSGTWNVQQNANGQYFLTSTTAPGSGVVLKFWYDYQVPIVAQAQDTASQAAYTGPNGGVFGEYISDTSLSTMPMALARAQRERTEYAFAAERATFDTTEDWIGWVRAGYVFQFVNQFIPDSENNYSIGIDDTFIVVANQVTFDQGGYRTMQLTGVRV